jgi:hypothetical protein
VHLLSEEWRTALLRDQMAVFRLKEICGRLPRLNGTLERVSSSFRYVRVHRSVSIGPACMDNVHG